MVTRHVAAKIDDFVMLDVRLHSLGHKSSPTTDKKGPGQPDRNMVIFQVQAWLLTKDEAVAQPNTTQATDQAGPPRYQDITDDLPNGLDYGTCKKEQTSTIKSLFCLRGQFPKIGLVCISNPQTVISPSPRL